MLTALLNIAQNIFIDFFLFMKNNSYAPLLFCPFQDNQKDTWTLISTILHTPTMVYKLSQYKLLSILFKDFKK
jgi:hypothetical protein